jgi:hypothetical protein
VSCLSTSLIVGPNGLWTSACSGASSESVCITGIISLNTEGTDLQTNVQCWPLWAGGAWTATNLAGKLDKIHFDCAVTMLIRM